MVLKTPYIRHRFVTRNLTNFPAPLYGSRTQVWAVCDKLMERVHNDGVPSITYVYITREQARSTARALNNAWRSVLVHPVDKRDKLKLVK